MVHSVRQEQGVSVVELRGDVDLESSPEARKLLLDSVQRKLPVVVDLSAVSYIDSSGVASLVESFQLARTKGCEFALAAVSESAMRVLKLARLDTVFTIHPTLKDGLSDGG